LLYQAAVSLKLIQDLYDEEFIIRVSKPLLLNSCSAIYTKLVCSS